MTTIENEAVRELKSKVSGQVLLPSEPGYDEARTVWNAMIDRRPAVIVRCVSAQDVIHAVRTAREQKLVLAVRGGGHNIAGNAVCDGGLMIDLTPMKAVRVDAERRIGRVEPGATLAEMDRETQAFGLATPLGINSTTGVAGLTLGGGFGWLSRRFGLSIDNLISADVVTATGELVKANDKDNSDLFWAIRGGGGNFGVVTSFEFGLHQVGPEVLSGLIVHPLNAARDVLRFYRDFIASTPEEFVCWFVLRQAPPLPFLPVEWHGKEILALAVCYSGKIEDGERVAKPLRSFGRPIADVIAPRRIPDPRTEIAFAQLGGAVSRVPQEATAYTHRDAQFVLNVHGRWEDPAKDAKCIAWARELFQAAAPFATGGAYVNFMTQEEQDRVRAAYGSNYDRLVTIKKKYDPENLFRVNQNIRPSAEIKRNGDLDK